MDPSASGYVVSIFVPWQLTEIRSKEWAKTLVVSVYDIFLPRASIRGEQPLQALEARVETDDLLGCGGVCGRKGLVLFFARM